MSGHHPWNEIRDRTKDSPERTSEIAEIRRGMEAVIQLERLRTERGMTQTELAGALNVGQSTISKIERSDNPYLETIREYVEGLGGELRLVAVFPDEAVEFTVPTR
ncbi:MAG: helix-turn-helix domain-containing protein [Thermomicrobiales bacterium]